MITLHSMSRRCVLFGLLYLATLCMSQPRRAFSYLSTWLVSESLGSKLLKLLEDKDSAKVIGREYLRQAPKEADEHLLIDLLCACGPEGRAELARADAVKLRDWLSLKQRRDFEHGQVVDVQGWILSETEVRLCALAAVV